MLSWLTYEPKFRPTTTCHVGWCFRSNSFLTNAAMSFSTVYFAIAWKAVSIASWE